MKTAYKPIKRLAAAAVFLAAVTVIFQTAKASDKEHMEVHNSESIIEQALNSIFGECSGKPLENSFKIIDGENELEIYVCKFNGSCGKIAFETSVRGYVGYIGVMAGFNMNTDEIIGVEVTFQNETRGLGSRIQEPPFTGQFEGLSIDENLSIKTDGGEIDAVSMATVSSRAVSNGTKEAVEIYRRLKSDILNYSCPK